MKGRYFNNLKYRNKWRILRIYHNFNYLFTSIQLPCPESNSDSELTTYILECGVTYSIKVFDKEVVLFKKIYAKLIVLESFSLNSKDTKSFEDVFTFNDVVVHAIYKS